MPFIQRSDEERRALAGPLSLIRADVSDVHVRHAAPADGAADGDLVFTGHAAVFDQLSDELGFRGWSFKEKVQRGAFRKCLDEQQDTVYLFDHEGLPLARTVAGTLDLSEDPTGLAVEARCTPTTVAKDLGMAMRAGNVRQMSFAFTIAEDTWEVRQHEDGTVEEIRTIVAVDHLYDVSAVSIPAYPQTDAQVRSRELGRVAQRFGLHLPTEEEIEQLAREGLGSTDEGTTGERKADSHEQRVGAQRLLTLEQHLHTQSTLTRS